ncbi:hypothetical protein ZYGR_0I06680 [Zygosaccharomyces rouxii]|uniref:ZYRO0C15840p n=2 Tax=Zygosaccharomyces rouxii TaxID=4956 RepID=C5DUD3_ZYGRC|nr:uncharacterized protein ZYRO0C15840g [Zygosaccharomyces rouxii]KAH9201433.1 hypothetical protein LQ764DRAFT_79317 [Zygosaccharomyces rouxii]GAV48371.1 hypothetical protein ZYGR_0I06680 [Zygosaccharomyces rouxii]CAR27394.1 ZYRO0C15840p [Zygosaccharomyces rouxii]
MLVHVIVAELGKLFDISSRKSHWIMSLFAIFKYLFLFYLVSSYKSLPGAYFVRFFWAAFPSYLLPRLLGIRETENIKKLQRNKYGCFAHATTSTYVSPFEVDFYLHKSNSTYFEELDFNRTALMTRIFQKLGLEKGLPYIPVANVFTNFLKEIKPFEKYQITSVILCWDQKWIYIMSRYTKKNGKVLCSLSLTKYVLKEGRKTVPPRVALEYCGLYNEEAAEISERNLKFLSKSGFDNTVELENLEHSYMKL